MDLTSIWEGTLLEAFFFLIDLVNLLVNQWAYDQDCKVSFSDLSPTQTVHAGHCLHDCTFELSCKMSKSNIIQPVYTILFCPHIQSQVVKPLLISWLKIWKNTNKPNNKLDAQPTVWSPWKQLRNKELRFWSGCLLRWSPIRRGYIRGYLLKQTLLSHSQLIMYI